VNGLVGTCAGRVAGRLQGGPVRVLNWISAGIFGALALRLAVMERG